MKQPFYFLLLIVGMVCYGQQNTSLSIRDAVKLALEKSSQVGLAKAKKTTKGLELTSVKNNQYPDLKFSGQYLRLTNAQIDQKTNNTQSNPNGSAPQVNQLVLGQLNLNLPLFSGFKLKNSIEAAAQLYQAESASAAFTTEALALQVIEHYAALYKAQKSVELLKESKKSNQQRVTDFTAMEQNGLIARNDLLKAQLQVSKVDLALVEAEKNVNLINYYLINLLKLDANTQLTISPENIDPKLFSYTILPENEAIETRKDRQSILFLEKAQAAQIKVSKGNYFPSIGFTAGYIGLNLENVVTVENAMNFGLGITYNFSSLFKNKTEVAVAKSKANEIQQQKEALTDAIKNELVAAREEYELAVKQDNVYTEAVIQSGENFRIVKDKYDNGLSNTNDLLEADVEQLTARINEAYAKANVALKYYELLHASGQLLDNFAFDKN
jgi:outer membrane protein TolC